MKMNKIASVFIILCCLSIPLIVRSIGNEKLTADAIQEETKEHVNNIPVDPGGGEKIIKTSSDTPVQTDSETKVEQTEKQQPAIKQEEDISKPTEQIQTVKTEPEEQSTPEKQDKVVEQFSSENIESKENVEMLTTDDNETTKIQPQEPGGDKQQQLESDVKVVEDTNGENKQEKISTDEGEKEKPGEGIQTFTEWTQEVLEKEKQKAASETPGSTLSKSKRSTNYASRECGAKVLASNPEAENIKAVLTNNKDEYMINPCKVTKKWFVIELCEPIHVSHFEVASFELFSSQPKTFRVYLSDRYPTKEWTNVGEFVAKEERNSQSFQVKEGYVVQFVRVEMLDHYGTEHFCPLTWFRLYGVPVEYDEDGHGRIHEDNDDSDNEDEALLRNGESQDTDTDSPKNLFATATDTVMKLVKKVLNVEEKTQDSKNNQTEAVNNTLIVINANDTHKNVTVDGYPLPCTPQEKENTEKKTDGSIQPHPPDIKMASVTHDKGGEKSEKDVSIVTKLEDHEQVPSVSDNLVTLIDSGEDDTASCDMTGNKLSSLSYYKRPICVFYELMKYSEKLPTCPLNQSTSGKDILPGNAETQTEKKDELVDKKTEDKIISPTAAESKSEEVKQGTELKQEVTGSLPRDTTAVASSTSSSSLHQPTLSTESVSSVAMDKTIVSKVTVNPSTSSSQMENTQTVSKESADLSDVTIKSDVDSSVDVSKTIQSSSGLDQETEKSSEVTPSLVKSEVNIDQSTADFILVNTVSVIPSVKHTDQTSEVDQQPVVPIVNEVTKLEPSSTVDIQKTQDMKINITESEGPSTDVVEPVVVGDNMPSSPNSKNLGLVRVPILPYQKRETAIMRLNNRIKALEMNVSLSSRFLDEMSRKFKKQTEDMIKQQVFNMTIGEISNMTKAIEIQSQLQKQKIDVLETEVQNLTEIVLRLTENMEILNQQVQDNEFKYIVTVVVCCIVILMLMKRKSTKVSPDIQQMGTVSNLSHVRRRNSFSGCDNDKIESLGPTIQKYNSESALVSCKRHSSDIDPGGIGHQIKKKKKKKHKGSDSSTSLSSENHQKTGINSAGLLFGAGSRESTPEENEGMKKENRAGTHGGLWSFFASDKQEQMKPKGPDKKVVQGCDKTNACVPKKSAKSVVGRMCNPVKSSGSKNVNNGAINGHDNGHHGNGNPFQTSANNSNGNGIYIVSPLRKGFSFAKGTSQNGHRDTAIRNQGERQGRGSHKRASSTDLTNKSVTFKDINGH